MVIGPDVTSFANESNYAEIDALLRAAFKSDDEAKLVQKLRRNGDILFEFVKHWNGVIGAYAALSRMRNPEGWACLAPLAVLPEFQNGALAPNQSTKAYYSFGTRLVKDIVMITSHKTRENTTNTNFPDTIVVLGKPNFYQRAGFDLLRAQKLISPYPLKYTLIARPGDDIPEEELQYPSSFTCD